MPRLSDGYKANFETLTTAFQNGDVALVDARRRSDGESVALVCAVHFDGEEVELVPFAQMIEGNPYEMYDPPAADGDGYEVMQ